MSCHSETKCSVLISHLMSTMTWVNKLVLGPLGCLETVYDLLYKQPDAYDCQIFGLWWKELEWTFRDDAVTFELLTTRQNLAKSLANRSRSVGRTFRLATVAIQRTIIYYTRNLILTPFTPSHHCVRPIDQATSEWFRMSPPRPRWEIWFRPAGPHPRCDNMLRLLLVFPT